jgi:hypothetical protein
MRISQRGCCSVQLQFALKCEFNAGLVSTLAIEKGLELANDFFDVLFD